MAQVAQRAKLREWIEDYLDYLFREWESIPALAAEWEEWDENSKLTFVIDWGVPEDRLGQLRQWAEKDLLTPAQRARYEELLWLVAQHRPVLERLLHG